MTCLRRLPSTPYRLAVIMAGTALAADRMLDKFARALDDVVVSPGHHPLVPRGPSG